MTRTDNSEKQRHANASGNAHREETIQTRQTSTDRGTYHTWAEPLGQTHKTQNAPTDIPTYKQTDRLNTVATSAQQHSYSCRKEALDIHVIIMTKRR